MCGQTFKGAFRKKSRAAYVGSLLPCWPLGSSWRKSGAWAVGTPQGLIQCSCFPTQPCGKSGSSTESGVPTQKMCPSISCSASGPGSQEEPQPRSLCRTSRWWLRQDSTHFCWPLSSPSGRPPPGIQENRGHCHQAQRSLPAGHQQTHLFLLRAEKHRPAPWGCPTVPGLCLGLWDVEEAPQAFSAHLHKAICQPV